MREKRYNAYPTLKKLLKQKNISYRKLSRELKISVDAINNHFNGYSDFRITEFIAVMRFLKIPPNEYFLYMEV